MTVADLALSNRRQIADLSASLPSLASRDELKRVHDSLMHKLEGEAESIRREYTPIEVSSTLQRNQGEMVKKQAYSEAGLACKMDKTEAGDLQQLIASLHLYDQFKEDTLREIDRLGSSINRVELAAATDLEQSMTTVNLSIQEINSKLKECSTRMELRRLGGKVEEIEGVIPSLALRKDTEKVSEAISTFRFILFYFLYFYHLCLKFITFYLII